MIRRIVLFALASSLLAGCGSTASTAAEEAAWWDKAPRDTSCAEWLNEVPDAAKRANAEGLLGVMRDESDLPKASDEMVDEFSAGMDTVCEAVDPTSPDSIAELAAPLYLTEPRFQK